MLMNVVIQLSWKDWTKRWGRVGEDVAVGWLSRVVGIDGGGALV